MMSNSPGLHDATPDGYANWLAELKPRIHLAQQRATLAVNRELVLLYWQIGHDILRRQAEQGWGAKVIDRLSRDLRTAFPDMKGFSPRNLKYMRAFAEAWPDSEFVQQPAAQLPWFHLCVLMDKLKSPEERHWYLSKAIEHSWSRNVLVMQIETNLRDRSGAAVTNFEQSLPVPHSDLARESLKDPYRFDFLGLGAEASEREIETALVTHVTDFLLELGAGFAYVGRQVLLNVGGDDFFIGLLFYHLKLHCYVVIEIKAGKFKPEHLGQLGARLKPRPLFVDCTEPVFRSAYWAPRVLIPTSAQSQAGTLGGYRASCSRSPSPRRKSAQSAWRHTMVRHDRRGRARVW